jgi:chromosome segregation ATPase
VIKICLDSFRILNVWKPSMSDSPDDEAEWHHLRPMESISREGSGQVSGDTVLSAGESIESAISNLEKRLATCGSVYSLAASVASVRDKDREGAQDKVRGALEALDRRITTIENTLSSIPAAIKKAVARELSRQNQSGGIERMIAEASDDANARFDQLRELMVQREQNHAKALKGVRRELSLIRTQPSDTSVVRALEVAVADLMQKQTALNSMLRTLKANPQD